MNNEHKDHKISLPNFNFERMSYISETDLEEDIDESNLPSEMQRLLAMEDKQIFHIKRLLSWLIWERIMIKRKSRLVHP